MHFNLYDFSDSPSLLIPCPSKKKAILTRVIFQKMLTFPVRSVPPQFDNMTGLINCPVRYAASRSLFRISPSWNSPYSLFLLPLPPRDSFLLFPSHQTCGPAFPRRAYPLPTPATFRHCLYLLILSHFGLFKSSESTRNFPTASSLSVIYSSLYYMVPSL